MAENPADEEPLQQLVAELGRQEGASLFAEAKVVEPGGAYELDAFAQVVLVDEHGHLGEQGPRYMPRHLAVAVVDDAQDDHHGVEVVFRQRDLDPSCVLEGRGLGEAGAAAAAAPAADAAARRVPRAQHGAEDRRCEHKVL